MLSHNLASPSQRLQAAWGVRRWGRVLQIARAAERNLARRPGCWPRHPWRTGQALDLGRSLPTNPEDASRPSQL